MQSDAEFLEGLFDRLVNIHKENANRAYMRRLRGFIDQLVASETVTIPKCSYDALVKRDEMLAALEAGGVDNWDWYSDSLKDFWKKYGEDEDDA